MLKVPEQQMKELMAAIIDSPEGLPEVDAEGQLAFIEEFFEAGAPELRSVFFIGNIFLRTIAPIMKGKSFSKLGLQGQEDLMNQLISSRNPLLRGITFLSGLPILMSYYRRPEVAALLGFDSKALKEEANLRKVSRDKDLPPKEEGSS